MSAERDAVLLGLAASACVTVGLSPRWSEELAPVLAAALAPLLDERVRAAKAEALREAADAWDEPSPTWTRAILVQRLRDRAASYADQPASGIAAKIEASSLGTPEAKAARASVSDETAARIVALARELEAADQPVRDDAGGGGA